MLAIDGETKLTGIIGYPLRYTISPAFQNAAFEHLGLNWCYIPLVVEGDALKKAIEGIRALNFAGVNVTIPYKEAVLECLDELTSTAELVEAVNTILVREGKLIGYNTDGRGFVTMLQKDMEFDPKDKKALIVGAGGAARAVAVSLALEGCAEIYILNRTKERAFDLARAICNKFPYCLTQAIDFEADLLSIFNRVDLIVNATPVGTDISTDETPVSPDLLNEGHLVCDLIYSPPETQFLKEAKRVGARAINGIGMLLYQGAASFEIWTDAEAPIEIMRKAIFEALELKER